MRRWTLTLFLMLAAGIAIALAPRLMAALQSAPMAEPLPVTHDVHMVDTGTPSHPVRPAPVPKGVSPPPVPHVRPVPPVRPVARPARPPSPPSSDLLIPELDEQPTVDWSSVPPPPTHQPQPEFWEDCPNCGMG